MIAGLAETTADGVRLRAQRRTVDARAHGELLAPQVHALLDEVGAARVTWARSSPASAPARSPACASAWSPRPRSGTRWASRRTASARSTRSAGAGDGRVLVATDARRREIYWAVYAAGEPITAPAVDTPAVAAKRAVELGAGVAVGDGAHRYADVLGLPLRDEPRYPGAGALAALAAARVGAGAARRAADAALPAPAGRRRARSPQGGASLVRLTRLRWWHIEHVLAIEADLFGAEQWTAAHVLERVGQRAPLRGRARRQRRGDRATPGSRSSHRGRRRWVQNIAVRRDAQRRGIGRAAPGGPARRGRGRGAGGVAGGGRRQRARRSTCTPATASRSSACGAATTNRATPMRW